MQEKEKKGSNILVYLLIFVLSLFIVLPPLFRVVFKEDNKSKKTNKSTQTVSKKMSSLQCKYNKYNYSIKATTSYKDDEVTKIILVYTNNAYDDEEIDQETILKQEGINKEIEHFSELIDAEYSNEGFTTKITLTDQTYKANEDDAELAKRFDSLTKTKKYYEDLEYTCTEISN